MVELGQLEKHHQEFDKRNVRVVVISNDDQQTARQTQADFPHLTVVADAEQSMARTLQVIHPGAGQHHDDTNAPTTFLVDARGSVRWFFRPGLLVERLPAERLVAAIDENLHRS